MCGHAISAVKVKIRMKEVRACKIMRERWKRDGNGEEANSCPLLINSARGATPGVLEILSCREDLGKVSSKNRGTPKNFQL